MRPGSTLNHGDGSYTTSTLNPKNLNPERAGSILDHGDGSYTASYVVETAGEVQLIVGLNEGSSKSMFTARCLPAGVAPAACEVEYGFVEVTAGSGGQLRFRTADRFEPPPSALLICRAACSGAALPLSSVPRTNAELRRVWAGGEAVTSENGIAAAQHCFQANSSIEQGLLVVPKSCLRALSSIE